jgi:ribonuclease-3
MARGIRRLARGGSVRRRQGRVQETGPGRLRELIASLPEEERRRALTHSSWVAHRADSYGRLAFLGDSVLGLAVAEHLFRRFPRSDIGRLTKVHGQAVSGRACAAVAAELGLPEGLGANAPPARAGGIDVDALLASERALASLCEAAIGACYLHHGFEATTEATVAAFSEQIEIASVELLDYKSALQELLAREGSRVRYEVTSEAGPPHDRSFVVAAMVDHDVIGTGNGRSKKAAEQEAAQAAMERIAER